MADITINHVLSGTVNVTGDLTGSLVPSTKTPVLETLNVSINPSQAQTLTPGTSIDGWNEVKVPQAMAIAVNNDFVVAMGGSAYDTIAAKNYIAVYDTSGHNTTRFYKGSGGNSDTLSEIMCTTATAEKTATVDGTKGDAAYFRGIMQLNTLVLKNITNMASGVCKDWLYLKHVDIECPSIAISAFENDPLVTIKLRNATSIGKQAFYSVNLTLTDIYIYTTSGVCSLGRNAFPSALSATVHVPADLLAAYQADTNWAAYQNITWATISE